MWLGIVASNSEGTEDADIQIHLILIGHTGVGKTSLRKHLKNEPINRNESPTIVMEPEFLYRESIGLTSVDPFKSIQTLSSANENKIFLTMWDTGGQPIFQDLLPCFARLKCMYGVVFRLPDINNLDSFPEIRPCGDSHQQVTSPFTNGDIMYRNLSYVQAFSDNLQEKPEELQVQERSDIPSTAAVVVGTCKDEISSLSEESKVSLKENKSKLEDYIREFIQDKNVSIYSIPKSGYIHEIDNTASGKKEDQGIINLRENISKCARDSSIKISYEWKKFKALLQRKCYQDQEYVNNGIMPLKEAIRIGKVECNIQNPISALMYFHEVGVFMWYYLSKSVVIRNFVVIDPKTLLDILAKLLCINKNTPSVSQDLLCKGILTFQCFKQLLMSKASNIDDEWVLAFLEDNFLSVQVTGQGICYFIPSLLPINPAYKCDFINSNISPIYIVPQSGYIPTGMFTRLLTALAGVNYGSTVWKIPMDDAYIGAACRNQFEFVVNDSVHVVLSEFSKFVRVDCDPAQDGVYFNIVSTLDVQLQRIVPRWFKKQEYDFTFQCRNERCISNPDILSNDKHFFSTKDLLFHPNVKDVQCSNGENSSLENSHLIWFPAVNYGM